MFEYKNIEMEYTEKERLHYEEVENVLLICCK